MQTKSSASRPWNIHIYLSEIYVITLRILRGSNFYENFWLCVTASENEVIVYCIFCDCLLTCHFERL